MSEIVISRWAYQTERDSSSWVFPDGCRDLIRRQVEGEAPRWFLTDVDESPRIIYSQPGEKMSGLRLRPGVQFSEAALLAEVRKKDCDVVAEEAITRYGIFEPELDEALVALSGGVGSVAAVADSLGVSVRTLQRKVKAGTGRPPLFWLTLARARRSARALALDLPLADIAFEYGYADQAHLSREMRRWFGQPPSKIRQNRVAIQQIIGAGFGTHGK